VITMTEAAPPATAVSAARGRLLRLPRIDDAARQVGNQVFGRAAVCDFEQPGQAPLLWRWHPAPRALVPALTLVCSAGTLRCALSFDADDGPGLDDGIELAVFDGVALQAAAALRYGAVLAHLGRISGHTFDDVEVHRGACRLDDHALILGFTLADTAQAARAVPSPRALTGVLQILPSQAEVWCRMQGRAAPLSPAAARLPVVAQIWLAQRLSVLAPSLRRLRVGGALLLGVAQAEGLPCRLQWPGALPNWSALLDGDRLHLRAPLTASEDISAASPRSLTMDSPPVRTEGDASAVIDTMPIVLDFHLGQTSLPLSSLSAALAPGYVIELGRPLDSNAVSVRANGQLLAHGELIQVGDQLAVRISRIATDPNSDGSV
jgi:flagellar motor switch/type III secretory pathway protein FliN